MVVEAGRLAAATGDDGQDDYQDEDVDERDGEGGYDDGDERLDEGYDHVARLNDS